MFVIECSMICIGLPIMINEMHTNLLHRLSRPDWMVEGSWQREET